MFPITRMLKKAVCSLSDNSIKEHITMDRYLLQMDIFLKRLLFFRLAAVAMAGLTAEGLKYDKVVGQSADLFTLQVCIHDLCSSVKVFGYII